MGNSYMRKSLPSGEHEFRYSDKGYCIVCDRLVPIVCSIVCWEETVGGRYFALCSDCCRAIMAIHESKDL